MSSQNPINELVHWVTSLPPAFGMPLLIVLVVMSVGFLSTIASNIRKFASLRAELAFKRELLDRGLNVEEIERVMNSHSSANRIRRDWCQSAPHVLPPI